MFTVPAHKQTDPSKKPGQIVHPLNHDMMDDMITHAEERQALRLVVPAPLTPPAGQYKPTHGGYPTYYPLHLPGR